MGPICVAIGIHLIGPAPTWRWYDADGAGAEGLMIARVSLQYAIAIGHDDVVDLLGARSARSARRGFGKAEVGPATAFAAALPYPLDAILALDHAHVAVTDDAGIGIVALPNATLARTSCGVSRGRPFGAGGIGVDRIAAHAELDLLAISANWSKCLVDLPPQPIGTWKPATSPGPALTFCGGMSFTPLPVQPRD